MPARTFRLSSRSIRNLRNNGAHQFALEHAFHIYAPNALYSMIPKNACSTLRFSIAVRNGLLKPTDDVNWIHANNNTQLHTLASAAGADYAFVVLRCPLTRIYSTYLDKICGIERPAWVVHEASGYGLHPHDLSFKGFLSFLAQKGNVALDQHWRPQADFLLFDRYDDYFSLENFAVAAKTLSARIGLDLLDTRGRLRHGTARLRPVEIAAAAEKSAIDNLLLKRGGSRPSLASMFDADCLALARSLYRDDIALYTAHFGPSDAMKTLGL